MLQGSCFCGHVRYQAKGKPFCESVCHCTICRRTSGAPYVAWFTVMKNDFEFTAGQPREFRSSDHATRAFCPRCGTPLTFQSSKAPQEIDVTTCSLNDPEAVPPKDHTHLASKLAWVVLGGHLPKFTGKRE